MSCAAGRRCGLDLALLWLQCRVAATALIRPLAWEPTYALSAALKKRKRQKKKRKDCELRKISLEEMSITVFAHLGCLADPKGLRETFFCDHGARYPPLTTALTAQVCSHIYVPRPVCKKSISFAPHKAQHLRVAHYRICLHERKS